MPAHTQQAQARYHTNYRRQQQGERQYLPATPGADQRQQLEVAIAHAFLAGDQLEHPVHQPQAQVPGHRAPQRIGQWHHRVEGIDDQAQPQRRQHQHVGQQLLVMIDQAQYQQAPGQQHQGQGPDARTGMPGHRHRQQRTGHLDQWITRTDRLLARRATPAQCQVTQHGNVLPGADRVVAMRAVGGGEGQVEALLLGGRQAQHFLRLALPLALEHDRQAMHHHVEEAAHQQAEHGRQGDEVRRLFGQQSPESHVQIKLPSWKIGRYIATTRPPTSRPRISTMAGSSRLVNWSRVWLTCSS